MKNGIESIYAFKLKPLHCKCLHQNLLTCALMTTDLLACLCFGLMLMQTSNFSCSISIPVSSSISRFSGISNIMTSGNEPYKKKVKIICDKDYSDAGVIAQLFC